MIYYNQYTSQIAQKKKYIYLLLLVMSLSLCFMLYYHPGQDVYISSSFLFVSITTIMFLHYRYISPLLMNRIDTAYFVIVLSLFVTLTCTYFILIFELNIIPYPSFIYADLIPLNIKIAYFSIVGVLLFFASRAIYLFINTLYLSNNRFESIKEQYTRDINELRLQSNPFFLYNSLKKIIDLLDTKRFDSALQYNTAISVLMNKQLIHVHSETITLEEELEWLKEYLQAEQLYSGGNFQYSISVVNDDIYLQAMPPLLLQPIVENLLENTVHGVFQQTLNIRFEDMEEDSQMGIQVFIDSVATLGTNHVFTNNLALLNLKKRIALINKIGKFSIIFETIISDLYFSYKLTIIENQPLYE